MQGRMKILICSMALVVLFFGVGFVEALAADLIILHTNDIHGRIELDDDRLGMPYISALVEYYRSQYDHVLVMDAGDTIHGRPITDRLEGESTVMTMNVAGYNVMAPGNHDFNFGYERLLELEEEMMEFDLVASNVFKDGELLFNPYVVKELGDITVGIFGLATSDTYTTTHPHNIIGIEFGDMIEAAEKYVDILRNEYEVDMVIALGHVGTRSSTPIAEAVSGIDLFVDGHSHCRFPEGEWHHGTLFVQAHEYTNYLGKVTITFIDGKAEMEATLLSPADADHLEPNAEMIEMLDEFRAEVRRRLLGN